MKEVRCDRLGRRLQRKMEASSEEKVSNKNGLQLENETLGFRNAGVVDAVAVAHNEN